MPIKFPVDFGEVFDNIKEKISPEKREKVGKVIDDTKEVMAEKAEKMKAVKREVIDVVRAAKEVIIEEEMDPAEELERLIEKLQEFQDKFEEEIEKD